MPGNRHDDIKHSNQQESSQGKDVAFDEGSLTHSLKMLLEGVSSIGQKMDGQCPLSSQEAGLLSVRQPCAK